MRACKNVCTWRPMVGVAALGIFALGLTVQAAPGKERASSASRSQSAEGGTIRDAADAGPNAVGQSRLRVIENFDGPVDVVYLSPIAGTNGTGQVYSNTTRSIGIYDLAQDLLGQTLTAVVPGAFGGANWVADPVNLASNVGTSCDGVTAEVLFVGGGSTYDATVCIFDAAALSTACGAAGDITGSAIACGTATSLSGSGASLVSINVPATLGAALGVYAHVSTNDAGVVLGGDVEIGSSADGATVGFAGAPNMCLEAQDISGGDATVSSNLWANVFCERNITMRFEAVAADGAQCANPTDASVVGVCEWHKEGADMILRYPGQNLRVEAYLSNFGGGDFCTATGTACDNSIDIFDRTCSDNGAGCFVDGDCKVCSDDNAPCAFATDCAGFPVASCNASGATCDDDCSSKFCSDNTTVCLDNTDCAGIDLGICGISNDCGESIGVYQFGLDCATFDSGKVGSLFPVALECAGTFDFCTGANEGRADYYYRQCLDNALGTLPVSAFANCPNGSPGADASGSTNTANCFPGDTGEAYGTQFFVAVPNGLKGRFYLGINPASTATLATNPQSQNLTPFELIPAVIEIQTGSCCFNLPNTECADNQTVDECAANFAGIFTPNGTCAGDGPPDSNCPSCLSDADCADAHAGGPNNFCTQDICDTATGACSNPPIAGIGADDCCNPSTGGLNPIDDSDQCTLDECNAATGGVTNTIQVNQDCDDGNGCTTGDVCQVAGDCSGNDINGIDCSADATVCQQLDTGGGAIGDFTCDGAFCECSLETKLSLDIAAGNEADPNCFSCGEKVSVDVNMGAGSEVVTGAQVLVTYDPTCVTFNGFTLSPTFPMKLFEDIDESTGSIFLAVGIMPGGAGTQGPATLLSLSFLKGCDCAPCSISFDSLNPQNTLLVNDEGNSVPLTFNNSKEIRLTGDLTLTGPEGVFDINPDCDMPTAIFNWDAPVASDSCDATPPAIACRLVNVPDGLEAVAQGLLDSNGGEFPQGRWAFECDATNSCGQSKLVEWTVEVSDQHSLDLVVQLSPIMRGEPIDRCICFEFFPNCIEQSTRFCDTLTFGGPFDFIGHATTKRKIPKGQFQCITAKDPLHSLRAVAGVDCDPASGQLAAEFKGDPVLNGNWLTQGNLDCTKKDALGNPLGNPDTIDILDFGVFLTQYQQNLDPNTPCVGVPPDSAQTFHSDINGDGVVDGADFTFISMNFLDNSKNSCCDTGPLAGAEVPQPITSITVKELRRRGLDELVVADLNNDGVLDQNDVAAFAQGRVPTQTSRKGAPGGNIRASLGN